MKQNRIWLFVIVLLLGFAPIIARANRIVAWGTNSSGQLNVPINLGNVAQITSAADSSAALRKDGTVVVWGETWEGQSSVPANLTNVVQIAAGWHHYLALKSDGTIVGWGWNPDGFATGPVGILPAKFVAAGFNTSFAVLENGTVYAWGYNDFGQRDVPANLTNVVQVAAGRGHALALKADGTVVAWGASGLNFGQATVPDGLTDVLQIAAGDFHSLALKRDGTVVAWGANWASQATVPTDLGKITRISAKGANSLALSDDNKLTVWGGLANVVAPSELADLKVLDFCAGEDHAVALLSPFDTDDDGVNNYREGKDGTNPNDATSFNPLSIGLVAYYPLDGNANDESGFNDNAVVSGAQPTANRTGTKDAAYLFQDNDQRITAAGANLPRNSQPRTLSAWVRSDNLPVISPRYAVPVAWGGSTDNQAFGFLLGPPSPWTWGVWLWGIDHDIFSSSAIQAKWVCLAVVYDGFSIKFYVDGQLVLTQPAETSTGSGNLSIGGASAENGNTFFDGAVDDVRIYNRALSSTELKQLFFLEAFTDKERDFLAAHPTFLGHYSQAEYNANRTNGQTDVTTNPSAFNLFTEQQYNSNRLAGQSDVISNPLIYGLYTSNSIMDLRMGGLMVQKQGTNATVVFQTQTTTNLMQPFTNNGTPITNTIPMTADKGFLRIQAR